MTNADFPFITETTACRCCGVEKTMGVNLYDADSMRSNLLLKSIALLPKEVIQIEGDDDLPKFVCSDCEITLSHFSEFCEMVKKVQKNFKTQRLALLRKPNVKVEEDLNQCHTSGVSKDKEPVTISIGADGEIRCDSCTTYLEVVQLSVLHMVTHGLGTVFGCCKNCGHRDEVGNFLQNKLNTVQCPQCMFVKKVDSNSTNEKSTKKEVKQNHKCEICSKIFSSKYHHDRHKMTHNGAKPFLCETCGTGFNQNKMLKLHMLSHTGLNPHVCQWCRQSFRFKESLRSHILNVHSLVSEIETKFECDRCSKQFATGYKLRRHYRSHTGLRPYQCPTCQKFFSQTGNLKAHLKKHKVESSSFDNTYETEQLLESSAQKLLGSMFDTDCQQSSLHSNNKKYLGLDQTNTSYALVSGDASKHTTTEDDMFSDFNPQEVLFADESNIMQMTDSNPHHMENSTSVVLPTFSSLHSASNDMSL